MGQRTLNSHAFKALFQIFLFKDFAWAIGFASMLGPGGAEKWKVIFGREDNNVARICGAQ
jgi:hypothetical protein